MSSVDSPVLHLLYSVSALTFSGAPPRIAGLGKQGTEGVAHLVLIRRRFFAVMGAAAAIGAGALQAAVRKVSVLSVTGPADWPEAIDAAEVGLVAALRGKGLAVVSLADSKTFLGANWQAAYSNVQEGKAVLGRNSPTGQRASRNTLLLADPAQSDSRRGYSSTFCRTAGELSRQMGADAAVMLTISASRAVQVLIVDQIGGYVFRERLPWDTKTSVTAVIGEVMGRYAGK